MNDAPNTVDVLLTGNTLPGTDTDQAAAAFAGLMRISPEQARALITGGKLKLLRRGLSPEKGLAVTSRLASLGIEAVMRPGAPAKPAARETPQPPPTEAQPAQPVPPPPPPKPELPQTYVNSIGMEFVLIPAGSFLMGSPPGVGRDDEHPQHQVFITRPFYLGKYPVTQAQWQVIIGKNPSTFKAPLGPVDRVSWNDAQQFMAKLNAKEGHNHYRLPSEAEWEYACRAGTDTAYSFGDDAALLDGYAWYSQNAKGTQPVGQKAPNPWGLCEMHGNVGEWVGDWYNEQTYYSSPTQDPGGPATGKERVHRGGSHYSYPGTLCRSAYRYHAKPNARESTIGFRLAMTADAGAQTGIGGPPKAAPVSAQVAPAPAGSNVPPAPEAVAVHPEAQSGQSQQEESYCTNCGKVVAAQAVACPHCGFSPRSEKHFCLNCGAATDVRQVMCVKCGTTLAGQAAPGAPPAAPGPTTYVPPGGDAMTFGKAVSTCLEKYADFSGRASRAEYWFFFLFTFLMGFSVAFILAFAGADEVYLDVANWVVILALLLPECAVGARRLHDTNRSGWWLLLGFIPIIGVVIILVLFSLKGDPEPNRFG